MALDLAGLGKVAGIGGVAVGATVLVLRPLVEGALPGLEPAARAEAVMVIAIGAFALGALDVAAWLIGSRAGQRGQVVTAGRDAAVGGRDAAVNSTIGKTPDRSRRGHR